VNDVLLPRLWIATAENPCPPTQKLFTELLHTLLIESHQPLDNHMSIVLMQHAALDLSKSNHQPTSVGVSLFREAQANLWCSLTLTQTMCDSRTSGLIILACCCLFCFVSVSLFCWFVLLCWFVLFCFVLYLNFFCCGGIITNVMVVIFFVVVVIVVLFFFSYFFLFFVNILYFVIFVLQIDVAKLCMLLTDRDYEVRMIAAASVENSTIVWCYDDISGEKIANVLLDALTNRETHLGCLATDCRALLRVLKAMPVRKCYIIDVGIVVPIRRAFFLLLVSVL
jgi:hypothetical protein